MKSVVFFLSCLLLNFAWSQDKNYGESIQFKSFKKQSPTKTIDFAVKGATSALTDHPDIYYKYRNGDWHFIRTNANTVSDLLQTGTIQQIYFEPATQRMLNDTMRVWTNLDSVHNGDFPLDLPYTGKDVIIGYVDTGLDHQHPDFQNADGSSRVLHYWDQTLAFDPLLTPGKYGYGQVWDSTDINNGTITSTDNNAHGTTVTGAGSGNGLAYGTNTGAAPQSDIIIVESNFSSPNWTLSVADAVDYIFSMADTLGKPAVVNTSLGTYLGSHDGSDPAGQIVDSLLNDKAGRILVAAAGNSGNQGKYHVGGTVDADTSFTWFEVNMSSAFGSPACYLDLWSDTADFSNVNFAFGADNPTPSFDFRGRTNFYNIQGLLNTTTYDTIKVNGNVLAPVEFYCEEVNGVYHIEAILQNIDSTSYLYRFETTGSGAYDLWSGAWLGASNIKSTALPTVGDFPPIAHYHAPDTLQTIVSSWTCLPSVVTVGNFTNQKTYLDFNSNPYVGAYPPGLLSINSSKGPNRAGVIKPDLAAPGDLILAACPGWLSTNLQGSNPSMLAEGGWHVRNGGTSMASPVIAGIAALYLEKCPTSTYQDFIDDLHDLAWEDLQTGTTPNMAYGYGRIDGFELLTNTNFDVLLTGDTLICEDPVIIGTNPSTFSSIEWSTTETTSTISVNQTDTISAIVYNDQGCKAETDTLYTFLGDVPAYPIINEVGGGLITAPADSIQWYFEGVAIDSANAQYYNPDTSGTYTVEVFGVDGCSILSDPYDVTITGIFELPKNEFIIFPNPSNGTFSILKSEGLIIDIVISDVAGKIVYKSNEIPENQVLIPINLEDNADGIYLMNILYEGYFKTYKLIKE